MSLIDTGVLRRHRPHALRSMQGRGGSADAHQAVCVPGTAATRATAAALAASPGLQPAWDVCHLCSSRRWDPTPPSSTLHSRRAAAAWKASNCPCMAVELSSKSPGRPRCLGARIASPSLAPKAAPPMPCSCSCLPSLGWAPPTSSPATPCGRRGSVAPSCERRHGRLRAMPRACARCRHRRTPQTHAFTAWGGGTPRVMHASQGSVQRTYQCRLPWACGRQRALRPATAALWPPRP